MPTALLIGFEYTFNSLTGAIIDLYHAKKWCESFGCDVHILTDIENVRDQGNLQQVVDRKICAPDILTFYDTIAKYKTIIRDSMSLITSIVNILKEGVHDNKLIIYYSGHGVKDCMVMPDRTLLPFIDFRDNILNVVNEHVEIFCILDCCNPSGMHLPYKLVNNEFVLSPTKIECILQPMLLITSSETNEKSIATKSGSVFSRHLFNILTRLCSGYIDNKTPKKIVVPTYKNRNLRRLIGTLASSIRGMHTGYAQTVSMYSSYIVDPILWMWIGANKSYDLVVDITLSILVIRDNSYNSQNIFVEGDECKLTNLSKTSVINQTGPSKYSNPYDLLYGSIS